ncbi:MAG: transposase [Deltaproteobacteria bacterium]|nr:transposase [Deltaproteobacteria bacterium]
MEKAAAVASARENGLSAGARATGIPKSTVGNWLKAADTRNEAADTQEAEAPANKPKRSPAKRYTPSQKAAILEYASEHSVSEASQHFDVSRFSIYQWRRKVRLAAQGKGDSPTSGPDPADVEAQRDSEILGQWHKHPGLGPSQIRNQLRRNGVKVAVNTVRRVMEDAGYRPPKVKSQSHDERFEAVRPNHLWHLDFVQRYINRASTFTLILLDDHSRFVVGHGVDDAERADLVIRVFEEAVRGFQRKSRQRAVQPASVLRRGRDEAPAGRPPALLQPQAHEPRPGRPAGPRRSLLRHGAGGPGPDRGRGGLGARPAGSARPTAGAVQGRQPEWAA